MTSTAGKLEARAKRKPAVSQHVDAALWPRCSLQRRHGAAVLNSAEEYPQHRRWQSHDELRVAIGTRTEKTYHRRRRRARLGRMTPVEFGTFSSTLRLPLVA